VIIPTDCVLCGRSAAGVWRIPRGDGWNVDRWLILCALCADREGAWCIHLPGCEDGDLSYPLARLEDLPLLVSAGVCWCGRDPNALVPWCPAHGVRARDLYAIEDARMEDLQTQRCADGRGED
jgi:hypothetical protein